MHDVHTVQFVTMVIVWLSMLALAAGHVWGLT